VDICRAKPEAVHENFIIFVAERQGFEPWRPFSLIVFKTIAIDHSAISPTVLHNISTIIVQKLD